MRYHFAPTTRMVVIKIKKKKDKGWQRHREIGTLIHCWWDCKMVKPLWKNSLAAPQNDKRTVTIWPSNSTPRYITKRKENTCLHKNLYVNAHNCIIHNIQKVETNQMSSNWWMDKQNEVYSYHGILFGNEKEWSADNMLQHR